MLKTLLVCYNNNLSEQLKNKFDDDFRVADKILMFIILVFSVIVAFVTSWQHDYFKLGMIGGAVISIVAVIAYNFLAGSAMSRIIMATGLVALLAIMVQQSNGLGEGHFFFFLGFTILIRYRDIVPLIVFVALTTVHHLTLTYCQTIDFEVLGEVVMIISWGMDTGWGLMAPLLYHVVFLVASLVISTLYIYDGNIRFVEANTVIGTVEKAAEGDLSSRVESQGGSGLVVLRFFGRLFEWVLDAIVDRRQLVGNRVFLHLPFFERQHHLARFRAAERPHDALALHHLQ